MRLRSVMPAWAYAARIARACAAALGLAMPAVRPLLLDAVPSTTDRIGSRSRTASASRFTMTVLTASAFTYPSAATSKVWHSAVG